MRDNLFESKILPWLMLAVVLLWPTVILARPIPYQQALAICKAEAVQTLSFWVPERAIDTCTLPEARGKEKLANYFAQTGLNKPISGSSDFDHTRNVLLDVLNSPGFGYFKRAGADDFTVWLSHPRTTMCSARSRSPFGRLRSSSQ